MNLRLDFNLNDDRKFKGISEHENIQLLMKLLEEQLNKTKSYMDNKQPYVFKYIDKLSISYNILTLLQNIDKAPYISNAYLKLIEILSVFKERLQSEDFVHFDNAALPGSWIKATQFVFGTKYKWYASSLISSERNALEDTFGLYATYKENWIMNNEQGSGDVTDPMFITYLETLPICGSITLYTSDIGIDKGKRYGMEEHLNIQVQLGQLLCGLILLKQGGSVVLKHYNLFTPLSHIMVWFMYELFDEVRIVKPHTSRPDNDEIYIVCFGYKKPDSNKYINILKRLLTNYKKNILEDDIIKFNEDYHNIIIPNAFLNKLYNIQVTITNKQINRMLSVEFEYIKKVMNEHYDNKSLRKNMRDNQTNAANWIKYFYKK